MHKAILNFYLKIVLDVSPHVSHQNILFGLELRGITMNSNTASLWFMLKTSVYTSVFHLTLEYNLLQFKLVKCLTLAPNNCGPGVKPKIEAFLCDITASCGKTRKRLKNRGME